LEWVHLILQGWSDSAQPLTLNIISSDSTMYACVCVSERERGWWV